MRLLILSCNTGEGHNSCAKAVSEYTLKQGDSCDIVDSLSFISERTSRFISNGHSRIYRYAPSAFSHGYSFAERHGNFFAEDSSVYKLLTSGTEELYTFLHEKDYDAILCTHVFSALQLTHLLRYYSIKAASFFAATDYTCSPGCGQSKLDKYFIPDASLADEFVSCGVPANKLIPSGIPVRQMFYERGKKADAKLHWGIKPEHRHLLIMCGSMGCGPMEEITEALSGQMPDNCAVSVVCGNNQKLYRKMTKAFSSDSRIHILGYVKDMSSLMDSADLYLTKPGGISVSEAAAKGLPMVFVNAVAGCESYNLRFFEGLGAAVSGETPLQLTEMCLRILNDERKLEEMSSALNGFKTRNAAQIMYESMMTGLTTDEITTCS